MLLFGQGDLGDAFDLFATPESQSVYII